MKRWAAAATMAISLATYAQRSPDIDVRAAWARPTVAGQMGTGAFMQLISRDGARLLGASSDVAAVVEIHEMTMEGNVMRMRPIRMLDLPAGGTVELKPGGHHMMLMDLKRPLTAGEKIKINLQLETRDKKLVTQPIEVEVRPRAP
ncbi:MAG TPA: copper chaperone PCu(A)C [Burkholderiaceae bacterium]|nr:copper chaperone PCu(A)C [Burkholderiaceae bacterium]